MILTVEIHRPPDGVIGLGQAADVGRATRLAAWCARASDRGAQLTLTPERSPYLLLLWGPGHDLLAVAHLDLLSEHGSVAWHGLLPGAA